jgi:hypothetical protein
MKLLLALGIMATVAVGACGKPGIQVPEAQLLEESPSIELGASQLAGRALQDSLIVLFRDGLTAQEWKQVFEDSQMLGEARREMNRVNRRISELEGRGGSQLDLEKLRQERDEVWVPRVGEALTRVYESSAYLAVWDSSQECRFSESEPRLICKRDLDSRSNPLAGGLPESVAPVQVVRPSLQGRALRPAFEWTMALSGLTEQERRVDPPLPDFGVFRVKLQLRPTSDRDLLTGSAEPEANSVFLKDGSKVSVAPRGYVELRLAPR